MKFTPAPDFRHGFRALRPQNVGRISSLFLKREGYVPTFDEDRDIVFDGFYLYASARNLLMNSWSYPFIYLITVPELSQKDTFTSASWH